MSRGKLATVMFSKASDEWETPQEFFDGLNEEFGFEADMAASRANAKCKRWFGPERPDYPDSLTTLAWPNGPVWLNPPYSKCREFIARAAVAAAFDGSTVVCLVPSRTDTQWWHALVWDSEKHRPRRGVEVRFVKGRLKFGGSSNSAPFPSVVIIFRPPQLEERGYGWQV